MPTDQATRAAAAPGPLALAGIVQVGLLAYALRAQLTALGLPAAALHLADGGFVLVDLLFVLVGFALCAPLVRLSMEDGDPPRSPGEPVPVGSRPLSWSRDMAAPATVVAGILRRPFPLHVVGCAATVVLLIATSAGGWRDLRPGPVLLGLPGPSGSGYPLAWSVPAALGGCLLLMVIAALVPLRPRPVRSRLLSPGFSVSCAAIAAGVVGTVLLLTHPAGPIGIGSIVATSAGPAGQGTGWPAVALAALGQSLTGLGVGVIAHRVLEGATGSLRPPLPGTRPVHRRGPARGIVLSAVAVLVCMYRSDLATQMHLLPVFAAGAGLVHHLARPDLPLSSPLRAWLTGRVAGWLGSRAAGIFVGQGPVLLAIERSLMAAGLDPTTTAGAVVVIAVMLPLTLAFADVAYRCGRSLVAPPAATPAPSSVAAGGAGSSAPTTITLDQAQPQPQHQAQARAERIRLIDLDAIPSELRLKPLPRDR